MVQVHASSELQSLEALITTKFCRAEIDIDDTVPVELYSRPYERVEIDSGPYDVFEVELEPVDIDLSQIEPVPDDLEISAPKNLVAREPTDIVRAVRAPHAPAPSHRFLAAVLLTFAFGFGATLAFLAL